MKKASIKDKYLGKLTEAGFGQMEITAENDFCVEFEGGKKQQGFLSITIRAHKPGTRRVARAVRGEAA